MNFLRERPDISGFFKSLCKANLPNKRDNVFQAILKTVFILMLIGSLIFTACFANYFLQMNIQQDIMDDARTLWESDKNDLTTAKDRENTEIMQLFSEQNEDFKAWLTVGGGKISYPVYQTDNNSYYKNHNLLGRLSRYGALYFDKGNTVSAKTDDFNLIINGNNMSDGTLFGELDNYRQLDYFKRNSTVILYFKEKTATYKIFAVFLYDPEKEPNLLSKNLSKEDSLVSWVKDIKERSYIQANINVKLGDRFVTLMTDSNEFKGAKTVVIARKVRSDETTYVDSNSFSINSNPKLP